MKTAIPEDIIHSAQITAAAYDEPTFVVVTREHTFYGCGGQYRIARKGGEWRSWDGHYTTPVLCVLP